MKRKPMTPTGLVCGTRAVLEAGLSDYRVTCATCNGGGLTPYVDRQTAFRQAVRDSTKPCPCRPSCGAA